MNKKSSGFIYIILSAVIFSTMEVMLKTVSGVFAPMQITALRFTVGGLLLIPFALRSLKMKGEKLHRSDIGFFALSGFLCVAFSMVLYQMAVTYTKASVVAVIFSCNPIFVTLIAHLILKEEIRKNQIIALVLELIAVLIIIDPLNVKLNMTGVTLSILAALTFAFYSVVGKKKSAKFGSITVTCFSFIFGSAELMALLLLGKTAAFGNLLSAAGLDIFVNVPILPVMPSWAVLPFLYICIIVTTGGYVCHMMAMEKTSAQTASLIFFFKPILAPIFAFIFLHEEIPFNMIIGIICFLIGSGIAVIPGIVQQKKSLSSHNVDNAN